MPIIRVAAPQWEPAWFDKAATTLRVVELIKEAADNGAKLVAFGELSIPGYPTYLFGGRMDDIYTHNIKYFNNSLDLDGPEIHAVRIAAEANKIIVHLGFSEIDGKTLYMGNVIIDEHGEIILHRRKIKPSHYERTLFGDAGPESAVNVVETSIGRISVLNCWEHCQPLLKYHTYSQRPLIHIAAWPLLHRWSGKGHWAMSNEAGLAVTRTVAFEAGAFTLMCSQFMSKAGLEKNKVDGIVLEDAANGCGPVVEGGGVSRVYGPDGSQLTESIPDTAEQIVYADLDTDMVYLTAQAQDVVGHYSRPDIFQLVVNKSPAPRVVYRNENGSVQGVTKTITPFKSIATARSQED